MTGYVNTAFLGALFSTTRVFLKTPQGSYTKIILAPAHKNSLTWQHLSSGQQQLAPTQLLGQQLYATCHPFNPVSIIANGVNTKAANTQVNDDVQFSLSLCILCFNDQPINNNQINILQHVLQPIHYAISALQASHFLLNNQNIFNQYNIPLPNTINASPLKAEVYGAINCSQTNGVDEVHLEYIYITELYCT